MSSIILSPDSSTLLKNIPLAGQLTQRLFTRKEVIEPCSDVMWMIERGAVRTLTWSEEGTFITLGYWGPGDLIGYNLTNLKPYQIECLTSVEVTTVPLHLRHQYIDALIAHIQNSEELLHIINRKPISLRLWEFLVWLSKKFGRNLEQGCLIELYITHQEIAEVLNTTRVTITRLLQEFETAKMLLRHQRRIILYPPDKSLKKS
ncbi:replication/maintenance protein [Nostoc sp. CENA543]|uniref:Crp/Fnr family transcriptional regulator n=1 Tax=Nostoc sp. CENA543 TaxID=1869241 RepID=UPI000CA189B6|nr:Crp/Fnr family transcriptional regulator [Nostoc sp. CENA543]AUT02712.1 replication/maintenance protein [Nostoc sp. CENA543]